MKRRLVGLSLGMALFAALLALAWWDVLPGGWTLRGWVEPHAHREARHRAQHRSERLERFQAERNLAAPGCILLAGSSTIERFPIERWWDPTLVINRGIDDEPCEELLARWAASLPSEPIGGAVLYLGSVDFRRLLASPDVIAECAERVLARLREQDAQLPLLVLGILPEQSMPAGWAERLAQTNQRLRETCLRSGVEFLDTNRPPLQLPNGDLNPTYAADRWHLNGEGYGELVGWLGAEHPAWEARLKR